MTYMETPLEIEGFCAYFDRETARVVAVDESAIKAVKQGRSQAADEDEDLQKEDIETAREILNDKTGRFIPLPDKSLFDENHHRARFVSTIRDTKIAAKLARSLREPGTFHLFQTPTFATVLYRVGLEEQWYQYLANARKQFVIQWAKENDLPYEDDFKAGA